MAQVTPRSPQTDADPANRRVEQRERHPRTINVPAGVTAAMLMLLVIVSGVRADEPAQGESAAAPEKEIAPNFTLPDAMNGMHRVKWPREKPVFLTFGEQASQAATQAWSKRLKEEYTGRVEFIGIAWLEAVPSELHATAQMVIKTSHPEVLVDKTGSCADRYQCKLGSVNAFVIAPDGVILVRIHEEMTDARYREVQEKLKPFVETAEEKDAQLEGDQP